MTMTYKEAEEYIENKRKNTKTRNTGGLRELCKRLGEPQAGLRFISVMGVTGRKSVTACLSSVLKCAGYKVGSICLSAVSEVRECIQAGGRPVTKQGLCSGLEQVLEAAHQMEAEGAEPLSLWEIETAMAFLYFNEKDCNIAVWESGYGCLKEMNEVISEMMAVVYTAIGTDKGQYGCKGPEKVAKLLAEYMKEGVPVISAGQEPEVDRVLRERADKLGCCYSVVDEEQINKIKYGLEKQRFTYKNLKDIEISTGGKEETENAVLALETMIQLNPILTLAKQKENAVTEAQLRKGLLQAKRNGSMTVLEKKPYVILKEVTNGIEAGQLLASLRQYFPDKRLIFLLGLLRTMDYEAIIYRTYGVAEHIITLTVRENAEGMHAYELAGEVQRYHPGVTSADSPEEAIELAHLLADKDSVIVAFGALECISSLKQCLEAKQKAGKVKKTAK